MVLEPGLHQRKASYMIQMSLFKWSDSLKKKGLIYADLNHTQQRKFYSKNEQHNCESTVIFVKK